MTAETADAMKAMIERAERGLKALPKGDWRDRARELAIAELVRDLEAAGARINARPSWEGSSMAFGKVKSTCTAGTAGVIRNWCVAARKRLGIYHE
jgi:hypothetical protein